MSECVSSPWQKDRKTQHVLAFVSRNDTGVRADSLTVALAHDFLVGEIRKQSTNSPSLLTLITSSGVPQTTLRVSNLLEGPTKCTESCYTHSDSLKGQIKVSQGK